MTIDDLRAFIAERLAHVAVVVAGADNGAPRVAWGDVFCTYDPGPPDADGPPRMPFATIVTRDYPGFDTSSDLDRPGVFRLNVAVGRRRFEEVLGPGWADRPVDPTALDVLMPHPVYAAQGWVSILNPSDASRSMVECLLTAAHDRAVAQHRARSAGG